MADESRLKIVVFGSYGAGKTTLIKSLDPVSKHIEANCAGGTTTVALDFGRIEYNGCNIHVYGTPGQERFEFAREIIAKGMDGAILLVDVTTPLDDFTRHLTTSLQEAKVPFVVFLNKCDEPGADPDAFGGKFGTANLWKISAKDARQCRDALVQFAGSLTPRPNVHNHNH